MMNLLESPRVRQLLAEAEEAVELLESPSGSASHVRDALDTIYRDLGKYVHGLARQDKSARVARSLLPLDDTEPLVPATRAWYTDEIDLDGRSFFNEGDLDDVTDIPEPDSLRMPEVADDSQTRAAISLTSVELDPSLQSLATEVQPEWSPLLLAFLDLLVLPVDLLDSKAMPEEASKVQWASGELNGRLPELPEAVQVAMVGLLAARARNLQAHIDLDIGPRMALDRLKRYREVNELPWVAGLIPGGRPERDTWAADAVGFWNCLNPRDSR